MKAPARLQKHTAGLIIPLAHCWRCLFCAPLHTSRHSSPFIPPVPQRYSPSTFVQAAASPIDVTVVNGDGDSEKEENAAKDGEQPGWSREPKVGTKRKQPDVPCKCVSAVGRAASQHSSVIACLVLVEEMTECRALLLQVFPVGHVH